MNLFPTTTTTMMTTRRTRNPTGPATPARVAERECKYASRMVAHGPRVATATRNAISRDYVRLDNVRSTGSEVVYHYAPARKVTFERVEIDHLPPDLLPSPARLSPVPRSFFSSFRGEVHFHNRQLTIVQVPEAESREYRE